MVVVVLLCGLAWIAYAVWYWKRLGWKRSRLWGLIGGALIALSSSGAGGSSAATTSTNPPAAVVHTASSASASHATPAKPASAASPSTTPKAVPPHPQAKPLTALPSSSNAPASSSATSAEPSGATLAADFETAANILAIGATGPSYNVDSAQIADGTSKGGQRVLIAAVVTPATGVDLLTVAGSLFGEAYAANNGFHMRLDAVTFIFGTSETNATGAYEADIPLIGQLVNNQITAAQFVAKMAVVNLSDLGQ